MTGNDESDLRAIADAAFVLRAAEARVRTAVIAAHVNNRSWTRIGMALGVSRQAARQRYAPLLPPSTSVHNQP